MNKQERERFFQVQQCIGDLVALCPFNQAAIDRKAIVSDCVQEAGGLLYEAISCIGFGDYTVADERLDSAEKFIARAKIAAAEAEDKHYPRLISVRPT